jgi:4-hydroxybenzoate polyprenyltransferase
MIDREKDRLHPKKRKRPLASGAITVPAATKFGAVLTLCGFSLAFWVSWAAAALLLSYATLNIAYSIHLKHVVIIDVFCIASGFMIRILVGTIGVGVPTSNWLMLCGLMITLFLGFAKRRAELVTLAKGEQHRAVLEDYGRSLLDQISSICAAAVIVTYCLYTTSLETIRVHNTSHLILTAPFLIYALFRYLYIVHQEQQGSDPSSDLLQDKHIVSAIIFWAIAVILLLVTAPL